MRDEISAAVLFLVRLIERNENCKQAQLDEFKIHLSGLLTERFENHWFPEKPCKGQGYRCIRVNECSRRDATLERAAKACGLKYEDLRLPVELTIWVDPKEVCCRFGEHKGSYCTLASFPGQDNAVKVVVENCPPEVKLRASDESHTSAEASTGASVVSTSVTVSAPICTSKDVKPKMQMSTSSVTLTSNVQRTVPTSSNSSPSVSAPNPNSNNRPRGQNSPKQGSKSGGRKSWQGPVFQHPLQPWYNMLPPHPWMAPSPQPYMLRSPPRTVHPGHPGHHRYHWAPHKPTLKV